MDSTLGNKDVLQDILRKVPFSIGGHTVDLKSVRLSGNTTTTAATATAAAAATKTITTMIL